MKVYSDTLTSDELHACLPRGISLDAVPIKRPRTRRRGWAVRLTDWSSRRHKNSGKHGAATWDSPAASYDKHGEWIAALYELDHLAVVGPYKDREDFHRTTADRFNPLAGATS